MGIPRMVEETMGDDEDCSSFHQFDPRPFEPLSLNRNQGKRLASSKIKMGAFL